KFREWKDEFESYRGLIECGECGCAITTTVKEKHYNRTERTAIYVYDHCTKRRGTCNQERMTRLELEEELLRQVDRIQIDKEAWELGINLFRAKHKSESEKSISQ